MPRRFAADRLPPAKTAVARPHRLAIVAFAPAQMLDISAPIEVFAIANAALRRAGAAPFYDIVLAAPRAGSVATTCGVPLTATRAVDDPRLAPDTLLMAGGPGARASIDDARLVRTLRRLVDQAPRAGAICTGTFPLAATGVLDGRRATTHWAHFDEFAGRFPNVHIDRDALFVNDGKFQTSAGICAGIDSALAFVEADLGRELALQVAREMVVFLKRPGGQSQFSAELAAGAADERFAALARWMARHLADDLGVEALAERMAMSPRNFARRFTEALGEPPARHVQSLRLDAARRLLTAGGLSIERVAARCGFASAETMRAAFARRLNLSPSEFRERFRTTGVRRAR